ncbi:hypothetical protein [Myxococcus landrumensis]|uniref:Uncharacterized protein n=1 Tax=Myxococcus landrumensis TaxID=2813577 RepID=A0ABX7N6Q1_9BACT|nr:hypothetical protein [Myxococcus landrumus]QSQ14151.1 hypothetical protein JY572_38560 [Myxococcus landrumus]
MRFLRRMRLTRMSVVVLGFSGFGSALAAPDARPVPEVLEVGQLTSAFAEFQRTCDAEGRRLWGHSLCAPLLVVHPDTRVFVASAWPEGKGTGPWVGILPSELTIANTALTWAGTTWVQLRGPLPEAPARRRGLLAHEAFHRLRTTLGHQGRNVDNAHLDGIEGRTLLQLEWRALAAALRATVPSVRARAVEDALAFRRERRARFSEAAVEEGVLEDHEGLAEYTGVTLGAADARGRRALALENLDDAVKRNSFVRSFAYASGPAYGLLLDEAGPRAQGWRARALAGADLGTLLQDALRLSTPESSPEREARHGGAALREAESERARIAQARADALRKKLVEGPVLRLPLKRMRIQFNPGDLVPLGEHGTVYPGARIVDHWGSLTATSEVLISPDWKMATVNAPSSGPRDARWEGEGWVLEMAPGWRANAGARAGDQVLQAPEALAPAPRP